MSDTGQLLTRIRQHGANLEFANGRLRVVRGEKLPAGALDFIKKHGRELAAHLTGEAEFAERAAIMEFDGGLTRQGAEYLTHLLQTSAPAGADAADWSWFVSQAAAVVDRAMARAA